MNFAASRRAWYGEYSRRLRMAITFPIIPTPSQTNDKETNVGVARWLMFLMLSRTTVGDFLSAYRFRSFASPRRRPGVLRLRTCLRRGGDIARR